MWVEHFMGDRPDELLSSNNVHTKALNVFSKGQQNMVQMKYY